MIVLTISDTILQVDDAAMTLTTSVIYSCSVMHDSTRYPQDSGDDIGTDFGRFFSERYREISWFVARRVSHPQDVQDIVAQTMVEFLESCKRRPEVRHFRALLYTIAKHRITDYFNARAKRFREVSLDAEMTPQVPAPHSMLHEIEVREELQEVIATIDGMREEDREMLTLHAIAGLSAEEIATIVDTSPGAIRVRLHLARKKLRRLLKEQQHGNPMDQSKD